MADTVWTNGNSDGDLDNDVNWSNSKPAAAGRAIWNATQTASCTVNTDNLIAIDLAEVIIAPGYTGTIGSTGEPLTISADRVTHRGAGTLYYTDGNGTTDDFVVDSPNMSLAAQLYGATFTRVAILRGKVILTSTFTCTDLFIGPQAHVLIEGTANAITSVHQAGGVCMSHRAITTAYCMAGKFTQTDAGGTVATFIVGPKAHVVYNAAGTITLAIVHTNGILDMSQDSRAKTITTARVFPEAMLNRGDALTITNGGTLRSWSVID